MTGSEVVRTLVTSPAKQSPMDGGASTRATSVGSTALRVRPQPHGGDHGNGINPGEIYEVRYAASRFGGDNQQGDGGRRGRNHGSPVLGRTSTRPHSTRQPIGAGSEAEGASGSDSLTDITREEWAVIAEVATDPPDLATTTFEVDLVRYVTDEQAPPDSIALTGVTETPVRPSSASDFQKQGNTTAPRGGCQGSPATLFELATVAVAARGYQREPPPRMAVCPLLDAPFGRPRKEKSCPVSVAPRRHLPT